MDDEPDAIRKKLKRAQTDSGSEVRRGEGKEGIANLIEIMSVARGVDPAEVEKEFEGQGYGTFKEAVGDAVVELLAPVRERYARAARRRAGARGDAAGGRRARARDRVGHAGRGARRDGRRPRGLTSRR